MPETCPPLVQTTPTKGDQLQDVGRPARTVDAARFAATANNRTGVSNLTGRGTTWKDSR